MTVPTPTAPVPRGFDPAQPDFVAFAAVSATPQPEDASPREAAKEAVLAKFAADNGLTYRPVSQALSYPGCIFTTLNTGSLSLVRDRLSTASGRDVEIGNFEAFAQLETGPDGQPEPAPPQSMRGFVALQMSRQLPNMILISKRRIEGDAALPIDPDPSQTLGLEGDFDDYFTLYCPKEFERDALYVFTPDLMALLIDEATPFDVEIVDTWMFLYATHAFDPLDSSLYGRIFHILDTIGSKVVRQTSFFSDPELGPMPNEAPAQGWHFVPNPALFGEKSPTGTRLKPKSQLPGLYLAFGLLALFIVGMFFFANLLAGRF
jgi:hypothetical protein